MTSNKLAKLALAAISDKLVEIRDTHELAIKNKKRTSLEDSLLYNEARLLIAKGWLNDGVTQKAQALDRRREIKIRAESLSKLTNKELALRLADFEITAEQDKDEGDPLFDFQEQFFKDFQKSKQTVSASKQKKLGKFLPHTQNQKKARQILVEMSKVKPLVKKDLQEFCKKMKANKLPSELTPSIGTLRNYFLKFTGFTSTK
jgi:hypothetical protein